VVLPVIENRAMNAQVGTRGEGKKHPLAGQGLRKRETGGGRSRKPRLNRGAVRT
jgi:hypothetical protein